MKHYFTDNTDLKSEQSQFILDFINMIFYLQVIMVFFLKA